MLKELADLHTNTIALVRDAARNRLRFTITENGRPVAALVSLADLSTIQNLEEAAAKLVKAADIKKAVAAILDEKLSVYKIILFGSYARGDAREKSDVDLLVISQKISNFWRESGRLTLAACRHIPAHIILTDKAGWLKGLKNQTSVFSMAHKEGKILYDFKEKTGRTY